MTQNSNPLPEQQIDLMTVLTDSLNQSEAVPNSPALRQVSALVEEWDTIQARIKKAEEFIELHSARRKDIEQVALPASMMEAGVTEFRTTSGRMVKIDEVVNGSIPAVSTIDKTKGPKRLDLQRRREAALAIIRHRWPGLLKTEVSVSLGREEAGLASRIAELIRTQFELDPSVDETVHPATLNAHFRELKDMGKLGDIPVEPFALYVGPIARIK